MRRAVGIAEAGDRFGDDLDPPGRRLERMPLRIAPEILEQHEVALRRRQLDEAFRPELLEAGQGNALGGGAGPDLVVDPLAPAHLVAALGEGGLVAEPRGERAEDVEVVPGLAAPGRWRDAWRG